MRAAENAGGAVEGVLGGPGWRGRRWASMVKSPVNCDQEGPCGAS